MACVRDATYDIEELLSSPDRRDFLIKNDDDEVEIESLKGKTVGLYFSAAWSGPCQRFTPILIQAYNEITSSAAINGDFEVVFVSADEDEESFEDNFSKMPWVAIPFFDSDTRSRLDERFEVKGLPHLLILDETGKLVLDDTGVQLVREYGADAYPFKPEKIQYLKHQDEEAKASHCLSLTSTLASRSRDYLLSADGNQVSVSDLEGKIVGLYFSMFLFKGCVEFTPKLIQVYEKLKANGENFEIVMIPIDDEEEEEEEEEESFKEHFKTIPWLSLPFKDRSCRKLVRFFNLSRLPTLVIIGEDGKIVDAGNAKEAIEEHGVVAFPFTPKRFQELKDLSKQKEEAQTLESMLISGSHEDFAIRNDGAKIGVASLVGKNILLYFSAYWSSPCQDFHAELMEAYKRMKEKDKGGLELIFVSSDKDEASFKEFFAGMPCLALPFQDSRVASLKRKFKVSPTIIPKVVAIGPDGRTVTKYAKDLIKLYGAEVYPFTKERLSEIERMWWPEKLKHKLHEEHELVPVRIEENFTYTCNGCYEIGRLLSFRCSDCDFDLHPKCAMAS